MIIAKDKAYEITLRFQDNKNGIRKDKAKQFALIVVDEIYMGIYNYLKDTDELQNADREFAYWNLVKSEIEKL